MSFVKYVSFYQKFLCFTSLQIFTSHAEPSLDEYLPRKDQQLLEQKHRDEEDKLYR